jgi:hypothetical protein
MDNLNPDIVNDINPNGTHTALFGVSVGGRKRRYKSIRNKKSKLRRKHTRKYKGKKQRMSKRRRTKTKTNRKQRGGINPTYRAYSASFEPGHNGMYANGPSVGNIIEQFN